MLLKGMLLGVVVGIFSVLYYLRWLAHKFGEPNQIDIRAIGPFFASFFGGMGIGVGVVMAIVLGAGYALRAYMRHAAGV